MALWGHFRVIIIMIIAGRPLTGDRFEILLQRASWKLHLGGLCCHTILILILEQEVNDGLALGRLRETTQLWVEKPHAEPDVIVFRALVVHQEAVHLEELLVGHLGWPVRRGYPKSIHDRVSQSLLGRSEHLRELYHDWNRHSEIFQVFLLQFVLLVRISFLQLGELCWADRVADREDLVHEGLRLAGVGSCAPEKLILEGVWVGLIFAWTIDLHHRAELAE